jgi:hypothetical protein
MSITLTRFQFHFSILTAILNLILPLTLTTTIMIAQQNKKGTKDTSAAVFHFQQKLSRSVQHFVDSTVHLESLYVDSLIGSTNAQVGSATIDLGSLTDSLVFLAQDSLDDHRMDSLRLVTRSLQQQMAMVETEARKLYNGLLGDLTENLVKGKNIYTRCDGCQFAEEFEAKLSDFREVADSLRENFHDVASSLRDDQSEIIRDNFELFRDSLVQVRDNLIERRLDEIDFELYTASRFVVSTGYSSHNSYRGRDNGTIQQMVAPMIEYCHSSGLSIAASTAWLDKTSKHWGDFLLSAAYNMTLGNSVHVSVSYAHFWFSDSSKTAKSVFTGEASAGLSVDWPVLSPGVTASLDIGSSNEFTLMIFISHSFEIPLSLYRKISIEPRITAAVGEQNSELTILRTKGAKGKRVVGTQTQVKNSFGILDYEVALPLTIELGRVKFVPAMTYIIPLNVLDQSTASGFLNVDFTISLTIR